MKTVTVENLHECTAQEVFDFVANHLLTQNVRSLNEGSPRCQYKGKNGLQCAAGCLIPDHLYTSNLEGNDWPGVSGDLGHTAHKDLIYRLQNIHDCDDPQQWPIALKLLAEELELEYNSHLYNQHEQKLGQDH